MTPSDPPPEDPPAARLSMAEASDVYFPFVPRHGTPVAAEATRQRRRSFGQVLLRIGVWGAAIGLAGLLLAGFLSELSDRTARLGEGTRRVSSVIELIALLLVLAGRSRIRKEKALR